MEELFLTLLAPVILITGIPAKANLHNCYENQVVEKLSGKKNLNLKKKYQNVNLLKINIIIWRIKNDTKTQVRERLYLSW